MGNVDIVSVFTHIQDPKTWFILCAIFIFADVLTGYLKAFKFKKVNSSISRDGYVKKIGWIIALLLGVAVDFLIKTNVFLIGSALVCFTTEAISVWENLGEIGVNLPFKKYFIKLKEGVENDN
jgi:toxin secretion/phage lysis holin